MKEKLLILAMILGIIFEIFAGWVCIEILLIIIKVIKMLPIL